MSGLEVVAGVLGVTQFGVEVIGLSLKFRKLWAEVKGASEDIDDLLNEIEDTTYMLQELECQVAQSSLAPGPLGNTGFKPILKRTQDALKNLQDAVQLLHCELEKSGRRSRKLVSSTKVVLKKPVLESLEKKLRRSMQLLQFATQLHFMSITTQATTLIAEGHRVTHCTSPISQTHDGSKESDCMTYQEIIHLTSTYGRARGRNSHLPLKWTWTGRLIFAFSKGGPVLSIQAPTWLSRSMYSIIAESTVCGPQITLRRYEIIQEWNLDVRDAMSQDDLPRLLENARSTGLSLFSTDQRGTSLIELACNAGAVEIMKGLLALGLGVFTEWIEDHPDGLQAKAWVTKALGDRFKPGFNLSKNLQTLHQLVPFGLSGLVNDENAFMFVAHELTFAGSSEYQNLFVPEFQRASPDFLRRLAFKSVMGPYYRNDITYIFPELGRLSDIPSQSIIHGSVLLHFLASKFAQMMAPVWVYHRDQAPAMYQWIRRCAAINPQGIHHQLSAQDTASLELEVMDGLFEGLTPFWVFVIGVMYTKAGHYIEYPEDIDLWVALSVFIDRSLPLWLASLQEGGVDLAAYGRRERELAKSMPSLSRTRLLNMKDTIVTHQEVLWIRMRIIAVTFGANIDDWTIWCAWEYEHLAKEFWDLVESPPCHHMPGAWEESTSPEDLELQSAAAYVELDDEVGIIWREVSDLEAAKFSVDSGQNGCIYETADMHLEWARPDGRTVVRGWR